MASELLCHSQGAILFVISSHSSLNKIQWLPLNSHLLLVINSLRIFYKTTNLSINVKSELGSGKNLHQFRHKNKIGSNYPYSNIFFQIGHNMSLK